MHLRAIGLVIAGVLYVAPTQAALIAADLVPGTGDALLTVDTATQLEWLDVTATAGQSYADVLSGQYVSALGFRFASSSEVEALWLDAGAGGPFTNNGGSNNTPANFDAAVLLVDLMGCTSQLVLDPCDGTEQNWHIAMYGDPPSSPELVDAALVDYFGPPDPRAGEAAMWLDFDDFGPAGDLLGRPDLGSYLVRAVPEPNTALLTSLGLVLMAATRHRHPRLSARRTLGYASLLNN